MALCSSMPQNLDSDGSFSVRSLHSGKKAIYNMRKPFNKWPPRRNSFLMQILQMTTMSFLFLPPPSVNKGMKIPVQSTNCQMMNSSSSLDMSVKCSIDLLHARHIDSIKSILTHPEEKYWPASKVLWPQCPVLPCALSRKILNAIFVHDYYSIQLQLKESWTYFNWVRTPGIS